MERKYIIAIMLVIFLAMALFFIEVPLCGPYAKEVVYTEPSDQELSDIISSAEEGPVFLINSGKSMEPTILNNSICMCSQPEDGFYNLNDIVAYHIRDSDGNVQLTLHRIVKVIPLGSVYAQVKGDNNKYPDLYGISENNIICKVPTQKLYQAIPNIMSAYISEFRGD